MNRNTSFSRETSEVTISGRLDIDGSGLSDIRTGLGFFDHMLATLAKHSRFDLELVAEGDLHIDDHHTMEDCAIVIGQALNKTLGDRAGIDRFADALVPLDEALCRAVVDLSGRPWPEISIDFSREAIGEVATENIIHFFQTLAIEGRMALHLDLIRGSNDHHKAEAAFKATARALRAAVRIVDDQVPSTKGSLT